MTKHPYLDHLWQELQDRGWAAWTRADLPVLRELAQHGHAYDICQFIHPGNPLGLRELMAAWKQKQSKK